MARSPKDDPRFSDMQHNTWNYRQETVDSCAPGVLKDRTQIPTNAMTDNNLYSNANYSGDVFNNMNKIPYPGDAPVANDDKAPFTDMPNVGRVNNQNYGNAMLNLGNGQLVRVFYDENNKQLIFPVSSGQYELFKHNQSIIEPPLQASQPSHMFTINQEYSVNANNLHNMQPSTATIQHNNYNAQESANQSNVQTSNFLKEVLGNWEPNSSGTYSPFGQNYPLNHPDTANILSNNVIDTPVQQVVKPDNSPKRNENSPLADTSNKKRIVAEVKPMRPSYSDVLAKNTKNNSIPDTVRKTKPQTPTEAKPSNNKTNSKPDKPSANVKHINDENRQKNDKKHNTISSGSESGDFNNDENDKHQKPNKKSKKHHISQKWSFEDVPNEENNDFSNNSQFMFIENQENKPTKKEKKSDRAKSFEKQNEQENDFMFEEDEQSQFVFQESQGDTLKAKKKKDNRGHHKTPKPAQDKKKTMQCVKRRNKPGYLGMAQSYLEHWIDVTRKAIVWFFYLLSDICGMSLHLSFDLCTSAFTQTYVSSQAVWRSIKERLSKIGDNKYLAYIDRKLGHTKLGFWRNLKWFKKESDTDSNNEQTKQNTNIPLPATGEEAMKRLLACKGKDPYSILGVSVDCTDEDIKRYYRRQAFLVHPDKNPQPGAEEAFKILQHAFELIGEPERRSAYSRRTLESQHAEAAWSELSSLLAQLHDKMERAANTIRCTNCGRRHKRVLTERPCYAARYCAQCKIRHSAKEGDIWAESSMLGLLVMYYACMDGAVYQITQWASCQKKNLKQLRADCHVVQYRIVLGNKAPAPAHNTPPDPNLEEFLNTLYNKSGGTPTQSPNKPPSDLDAKKRRNKKTKP